MTTERLAEIRANVADLQRISGTVPAIFVRARDALAALLAHLDAVTAEREELRRSGRAAIDAGEVLIATLTRERDEARGDCARLNNEIAAIIEVVGENRIDAEDGDLVEAVKRAIRQANRLA